MSYILLRNEWILLPVVLHLHGQGDPEGEILGIQTELEDKKDEDGRWQKLNTAFSALWYKGKAVITGTVLKQVLLLNQTFSWQHAQI